MSDKISMLLVFGNISETKVNKDVIRKLLLPCGEDYKTPIEEPRQNKLVSSFCALDPPTISPVATVPSHVLDSLRRSSVYCTAGTPLLRRRSISAMCFLWIILRIA
jgi:hypothetical protein